MDLISSRSIPLILHSSQWPAFVEECVRVLRPGGVLEITILDPIPRNCGPVLRHWTAKNLVLGLERRFLVTHPAMIIPLWLGEVPGFERRDRMIFTYSAIDVEDPDESRLASQETTDAHPQPEESDCRSRREIQRLRTAVGRYFYQALYCDLIPEVSKRQPGNFEQQDSREAIRHWWWKDPAIIEECKKEGTMFEMITYKCVKGYQEPPEPSEIPTKPRPEHP